MPPMGKGSGMGKGDGEVGIFARVKAREVMFWSPWLLVISGSGDSETRVKSNESGGNRVNRADSPDYNITIRNGAKTPTM